jgi:hypothetical protein
VATLEDVVHRAETTGEQPLIRSRWDFLRAAAVRGASPLYWGVGVVTVLLGGSVLAASWWLLDRPRLGAFVAAVLALMVVFEGAFRLWRDSEADRIKLREASERVPRPYLRLDSADVRPASIFLFPRSSAPAGFATASAASVTSSETYAGGTVPSYPAERSLATGTGPPATRESPCFARVNVTNDPPNGLPATEAAQVVATLSFYDEDGTCVLQSMQGRWAASKQEHERDRIGMALEHLAENIAPNALAHPIDVAMKHRDERDCFAWNDENSHADGGRLEEHRLTGERFHVEVKLRAANDADEVVSWFVLGNPGGGRDLLITPVEEHGKPSDNGGRPHRN